MTTKPVVVVSFISNRIQQWYRNTKHFVNTRNAHNIETLLHSAGGQLAKGCRRLTSRPVSNTVCYVIWLVGCFSHIRVSMVFVDRLASIWYQSICKHDVFRRHIRGLQRNEPEHTRCSLLWRHSGRDGVSNHQPRDCLLNRWFGRRSKKTSKFRVTGHCVGNSPITRANGQ